MGNAKIVDRLPQPSKAVFPISVTELGIMTEARRVQELKALLWISVTELGIVTEVKLSS